MALSPQGQQLESELLTVGAFYVGESQQKEFLSRIERFRVPPHEVFIILDTPRKRPNLGVLFALRAIREIYGPSVDPYYLANCRTRGHARDPVDIAILMGSAEVMREAHRIIQIPDDMLRMMLSDRFREKWPKYAAVAQSILYHSAVKRADCD